MKLSNLRKETKNGECYLVSDVTCNFANQKELWFSVPIKYADWLSDDVYDAFLVAALYPAMYYGEDIEIEGVVSHQLYFSMTTYIQHLVQAYRPEMLQTKIKVRGFKQAEKVGCHVGTGFSAGIDSLTTLFDRFEREQDDEYKIDALFFFNVGSHGGGGVLATKKFKDRYEYLSPLPSKLGLPFIKLDSNLFDFYRHEWEFDAGIFCRATGILVFQRKLAKYYISADNSYYEHMRFLFDLKKTDLSSIAESFLHPLLSTEGLSIITDGTQYTRTQKTELIVDYWPTKEYLNVCVSSHDSVKNCTMCHKCLRTVFALDVMGRLEDYAHLFEIEEWEKRKFKYKCQLLYNYHHDVYAHDNVDYARSKGYSLPPRWFAMIVMLPVTCSSFIKRALRRTIGDKQYRKLWNKLHK